MDECLLRYYYGHVEFFTKDADIKKKYNSLVKDGRVKEMGWREKAFEFPRIMLISET